jgi:hypothetical protein
MANPYGAIYGTTWWGSQNSIDFGNVIFYIYAADRLKTRALDAGGLVEGFGCIAEGIREMPMADSAAEIFTAYAARVVADGGTTEARVCTIKEIGTLRL